MSQKDGKSSWTLHTFYTDDEIKEKYNKYLKDNRLEHNENTWSRWLAKHYPNPAASTDYLGGSSKRSKKVSKGGRKTKSKKNKRRSKSRKTKRSKKN